MKSIILSIILLLTGCTSQPPDINTGDTATLYFSSFDGGGPEYSISIDDPSIISYSSSRHYNKPDHEEMTGAGYDIIYTFTGLKSGETTMIIEERSPIADNADYKYKVAVDDKLNVDIEFVSAEDMIFPYENIKK